MTSFDAVPEFNKDYKKLAKRFRTLDQDLELFKEIVRSESLDFDGTNATIISAMESGAQIIKARLFCRTLRKNTLRLVYFHKDKTVTFIEVYFKGDKPREDSARIQKYQKLFS